MRTIISTTRNILLVAVLVTAILMGASGVSAATLTAGNDYPSTLQISQQANHSVIFTTPTGIAEGETLTITFATAFNTSSITEDDVDIADDGVDLTTGSTCASTEQASVSIASDVVTITICAGDGGAIAATSQVTVEIGTNATSSGTGVNNATNPSSAGTYFVSIAGTFSDSGSIALPIGGDDSIPVTATIPEPESGGGSDPLEDSTAPSISGLVVSSISSTSAIVSWSTDESGTSVVNYGLTDSLELGSFSESGYSTSHVVTMTGLLEGQTYYISATSADSIGNSSTSSTTSFTTLDATPPVLSDIEVIDIGNDSARVTWTTNEVANSVVSYGETDSYESTVSESDFVTSHSILLTGLSEGTEYHFQVGSTDQLSNQVFSTDETFTTDEDLPPSNVSGLVIESGISKLLLSWTNPTDDDLAGVLVLFCEDEYPDSPTDIDCSITDYGLVEEVTLSGLSASVTYYLGVFSYDDVGQFASGALGIGLPSAPEEELPPEEDPPEEDLPEGDELGDDGDDGGGGDSLPDSEPDLPDDDEDDEDDSSDIDSSTGLAVSCGDGVCSESESEISCPVDCASDSEPTSLGAEEGELSDGDIEYLVADRSLSLETTSSGVVEVLPTSTLSVQIPATELADDVSSIQLSIGSELFLLSLDETLVLYNADVTVSAQSGIQQATVTVLYDDGSTESVSSYLRVVTPGYIYQVIDGEEAPVTNANITLYEVVGGEPVVWDGSPHGQFNPTNVNSDGTFSWYVPNGTYVIEVQAEGFETTRSGQLVITNSIVNHRIAIASYARMEDEDPITAIGSEGDEEETVTVIGVIESVLDLEPVQAVRESLEAVRDLPGVEEAAEVSVPTLAVTAGASVVMLSVAFDFFPFLQYLFTAPILFFWRRRRKSYGVVYNAISKTPVDLAVVRLFKVTSQDEAAGLPGRLVKSRVTDKGGRYFFLVDPGRYRITATKGGFQFPSEYMAGEKTDGQYLDVYHLEPIEVTEASAVISANIPLDPVQQTSTQATASYKKGKFLRALQHTVALTGVIAAVVFALIRPTPFSIGMIVIQLGVLVLAKRLARPRKPISWGVVYDKITGRPLSRVVTRIFEPKYNKVLETQVTDSKGRYSFMLGPNTYYATFQKDGFKSAEIRPIDYSELKEPVDFSQEVSLEPSETTPSVKDKPSQT